MSDFDGLGEIERRELDLEQSAFAAEILADEIKSAIYDRQSREAEGTEAITISHNIDGTRVFAHIPPRKYKEQGGN